MGKEVFISYEICCGLKATDFYFKIRNGDVFFSFHYHDKSCAMLVKARDFQEDKLFSSIEEIIEKMGISADQIECKMVGCQSKLDFFSDLIVKFKFSNIKKVPREDVLEVLYSSQLGKVKVSKSETVLNMPQAIPVSQMKKKAGEKIKVLIVDDSSTIRNILSKIFKSDPELEVCAVAEKPSVVEKLIEEHSPDVITLDIHMPEMDGVTLLKKIAPKYHIPTVMITSISISEGPIVLEALEYGAVDYIQKPEVALLDRLTPIIIEKIKTAAKANVSKNKSQVESIKKSKVSDEFDMDSLVLIGASTGGTEAIREILAMLPHQIPPMLIVQHIPPVFSAAFAKRMNEICPFEVKEAEDGDEIRPNRVLVAPGGKQMKLEYKNKRSYVVINDDEPVNRFKPSVDYMFLSAAKCLYTHTVAVLLTGMGKDGAQGMLALKKAGVRTIAQDEKTSVVWGMPREAVNLNAAEYVEPLDQIAEKIVKLTHEKHKMKKIG